MMCIWNSDFHSIILSQTYAHIPEMTVFNVRQGMSRPLPWWERALHQMWVCISCRYVCDRKPVEVSNSSDKSPPQKKRLASVSHGSCQLETTQRCLNHIIRVLPPLFINVARLRFCLATVRAKGGSASKDIQRDSRHHHTVSRQWGTVSEVQMRRWRQIRQTALTTLWQNGGWAVYYETRQIMPSLTGTV